MYLTLVTMSGPVSLSNPCFITMTLSMISVAEVSFSQKKPFGKYSTLAYSEVAVLECPPEII